MLTHHQTRTAIAIRQPLRIISKPLLTLREREVLYLITHEYSTKEIAQKLFISYETANRHRRNIMSKLEVKNTAGMVRVAFEREILTVK